jgi:hypothetical protein
MHNVYIRLVRENHQPRIEDDLKDRVGNRPRIWTRQGRRTGNRIWQPVATLNQTVLAAYISKRFEYARKREDDRPSRAVNSPSKWHQ